MCGIIYSTIDFSSNINGWLESLKIIECRGPDKINQKFSKSGSFGHSRLEIIGLGAPGAQPYTQNENEDCLIYNGEIYNYRELAKKIGSKDSSDTEVLYTILRNKAYDLISEIRGMYAFIYVDFKENVIVTGRDKFGIKPLYYSKTNSGEISFASVPSALIKISADKEINYEALAGYIATGLFHAGSSILQNIIKIKPGSILKWEKVNSNWQSSQIGSEGKRLSSMSLSQALETSVKNHLISDVPLAILMSGGVDSTLLATLASKFQNNLSTYCLVNPDFPEIDESNFAKENSRLLGTDHREVEFVLKDAKYVITDIIKSSGEPLSDAAYIPLSILCKEVSKNFKVVLAGEGADEVFGGYKRYEVQRYVNNPISKFLIQKITQLILDKNFYLNNSPSQKVRALSFYREAVPFEAHSKLLFGEWEATLQALPVSAGKAYLHEQSIWLENERELSNLGINGYRAYDIKEWLPNVFLEKSDRASMLNGVEVRVPFLDEYIWQNVDQSKIHDSKKTQLRNVLLKELPGVKLPNSKMGLSVAISKLIEVNNLDADIDFILGSKESILSSQIGSIELIKKRASLSPELAFRLATLAYWQYNWL